MDGVAVIKTCSTCKYYVDTLYNDSNAFHIHNYCQIWRAPIPAWYYSDQNDEYLYDDIEMKIAHCWCYEAIEQND